MITRQFDRLENLLLSVIRDFAKEPSSAADLTAIAEVTRALLEVHKAHSEWDS